MKTIPEEEGKEKYGRPMKDGDETFLSLASSEKLFFWDHRTIQKTNGDSGCNFLKNLDEMLKPHGLEVVKIKFDGDAVPWTIEKR